MATETAGRITPEQARAWWARYLEAWNSHDADRVLALATDDIVWEDPSIVGGVARGKPAVREWLESIWRASPDMTFEVVGESLVALDGTSVASVWRFTGHFTGPMEPPGFAPTGGPIELSGVDVHTLEGDRVQHVRTFSDTAELGRQVGALPEPGTRREKVGVILQRLTARRGRPKD
jgi:steroid delta-isomerase-like uncharacterized protein